MLSPSERPSRRGRRRRLALAGATAAVTAIVAFAAGIGSAASSAVPANTSPPTISGTARVGSTLTANRGSWTNAPTTYRFEWRRCDSGGNNCTAVDRSSRYTLRSADQGHTLRVNVTASNSSGSAAATSPSTAVVPSAAPANTSPPTISGTARVGSTLTANRGAWTNSPTSYRYEWRRCDSGGNNCTAVDNGSRYTLRTSDQGSTIRVNVTASNSSGSGNATSAQTAVVQPGGGAPANTSRPTISGTTQEGQTLTASPGKWSGTNPISYGYQWMRCDANGNACGAITGATGTTYNTTSSDVTRTLRVHVSARNSRGSASADSDPTSLIGPARGGGAAISVTMVNPPQRLVVDRVRFSPQPLGSRRPLTGRFHVSDTRGFSVQGALVFALGIPYSWVRGSGEVMTDSSGWATIVFRPTARLPLQRGTALVVFVRARKPGDNVLAGVSTRRLVQARIR